MTEENTSYDGTYDEVNTPDGDSNQSDYEKRYKDIQTHNLKLTQEKKELEVRLAAANSSETLDPLKQEMRSEVQKELAKDRELTSFLQNRSELADKVEALKALQETLAYQGKSLDEIADVLYGAGPDTQAANNRVVREVALGETPRTSGGSLEDMSDDEIRALSDKEYLELRKYSDGLSKRR